MKKILLLIISLFSIVSALKAQSIISISPASGIIGQTLSITIQGSKTHFLQSNGNAVSLGFMNGSGGVNFVNALDDTSLIVNFSIPNNILTDDYDIIVTNNIDGNILAYNAFFVSGISHSRIVNITPAVGTKGQTLNVRLNGSSTHFSSGNLMAVYFDFAYGSTAVNNMTVLDDTTLDVNITIPPNTITGNYDVSIFNTIDSSLTKSNSFYVYGMPQPKIISVSPSTGISGQTINVSITGIYTHFSQAPTQVYFGFLPPGTVANSLSIVNDSLLIANVSIPANAITGYYDVSTLDSIDRYINKFHAFYVNGNPGPIITSITPATGSAGETLDITINAAHTHFLSGTTSTIYFVQGNRSIITNSFNRVDDTTLTANISITNTSPQGLYSLYIFNYIDNSIITPDAFLVAGYYAINEFENASEPYHVYPNPFDTQFSIEYEMPDAGDVIIDLYDISGKKISSIENERKSPGKYQVSFNDDEIKAGFYLLRMQLNETPYFYKMVKR